MVFCRHWGNLSQYTFIVLTTSSLHVFCLLRRPPSSSCWCFQGCSLFHPGSRLWHSLILTVVRCSQSLRALHLGWNPLCILSFPLLTPFISCGQLTIPVGYLVTGRAYMLMTWFSFVSLIWPLSIYVILWRVLTVADLFGYSSWFPLAFPGTCITVLPGGKHRSGCILPGTILCTENIYKCSRKLHLIAMCIEE